VYPLFVHRLRAIFDRVRRLGQGDGILATKLGYNPNSSSLGVDVTFLLFGLTGVAMLTPLISALLSRGGHSGRRS